MISATPNSPDLQVLELPYVGGDLSMLVLLPRKVDGLGNLEAELTTQNLTSWTANLQSQKVEVFLPKFKINLGVLIEGNAGCPGNVRCVLLRSG